MEREGFSILESCLGRPSAIALSRKETFSWNWLEEEEIKS
jgi:hypothetical protein